MQSACVMVSPSHSPEKLWPAETWLEAQRMLVAELQTLHAYVPEIPDSRPEFEKWVAMERSRRPVIDQAVRHWLNTGEWPEILDACGKGLVIIRLRLAMDWLSLGPLGCIHANHTGKLLDGLLLEAWPHAFLPQYLIFLRYFEC